MDADEPQEPGDADGGKHHAEGEELPEPRQGERRTHEGKRRQRDHAGRQERADGQPDQAVAGEHEDQGDARDDRQAEGDGEVARRLVAAQREGRVTRRGHGGASEQRRRGHGARLSPRGRAGGLSHGGPIGCREGRRAVL